MADKPKRRYRRRNLSDKEVQAEFNKWLARTAARGIDPDFTRWLCANEQGFASVDGVALVYERLEYKQRCQIVKDCLAAAKKTVPARSPRGFNQRYTYHSMFAALGLKLALDTTYRGLLLHLSENFPERYLIFEKETALPSLFSFHRFDVFLTDDTWKTFLSYLSDSNLGLALLLESRHVGKETKSPVLVEG